MTFVEMCLKKEKKPEDIDDFIESWHKSSQKGVALHEAIGIPIEVFSDFLIDGRALDAYILRRKIQMKQAAATHGDMQTSIR